MSAVRAAARVALGGALILAGVSHLTFARRDFRAQVPDTVVDLSPLDEDGVVLASGVVEVALGSAIAFAPERHRPLVGRVAAGFFTAIFPGNLSQWIHRRDAFGLDTDERRFGRLFLQPVLIAWALWATRAPRR
ncbi:DoxX family protein [Agrococcus sediminis]|uniref:DoxX family protein n=1 Tax=Agrococcus sediminis TaxID=2599924 RepID=UPI0034390771